VVDALGSEDVGGEEAVYGGDEDVLADGLPLAVSERLGGLVSVGDAVAACVVGDALAFLAMHPQWVVSGGAVGRHSNPSMLLFGHTLSIGTEIAITTVFAAIFIALAIRGFSRTE
jgi:hypothetical protein